MKCAACGGEQGSMVTRDHGLVRAPYHRQCAPRVDAFWIGRPRLDALQQKQAQEARIAETFESARAANLIARAEAKAKWLAGKEKRQRKIYGAISFELCEAPAAPTSNRIPQMDEYSGSVLRAWPEQQAFL